MDEPTNTPAVPFQVGDLVAFEWAPERQKRIAAITPSGTIVLVDAVGPMLVTPKEQAQLHPSVPTPTA